MKKTLKIFAGLVIVLLALHGRADKLTIAVSTQGPDRYADNDLVVAGETYLLVYVRSTATGFDGVLTDGSLANPDGNVQALKLYADGTSKCPYTPITYDSADYAVNGTWVIVLLDTRKADGSVGGPVAGYSSMVASPSKKGASSTSMNSLSGGNVVVGEMPFLPAGVTLQKPVIASMQQGGAAVTLGIKDFSYNVNYEVQTTTDLQAGDWVPAKAGLARRLAATAQNVQNGELKEDVPVSADDATRFFRVVVPGK
jgi:hypothetical protein